MSAGVSKRPRRRYTAEFRDDAVKMVIELERAIAQVARDLGINEAYSGVWLALSSGGVFDT